MRTQTKRACARVSCRAISNSTRKIVVAVLVLILSISSTMPVTAGAPYLGYTFDFWGGVTPAPVAYLATRSIMAQDLNTSTAPYPHTGTVLNAFLTPADLSVDSNNVIYLLDSGNNRIVIFDQELNLLRVIYGFDNNGEADTFNRPSGIFVCYHLNIYIADTENRRVVILDNDGNLLSMIYNPDLGEIDDAVDFRPQRVVADRAGRVYVIVMHVFEGIMRFNEHGEFFGYVGTIDVRVSAADLFWRWFATQAQIDRGSRFIPTEFLGVDIDDYGFVFATHADVIGQGDQVMRLNPRGNNVIRNFNENINISGDQRTFVGGPSVFVDVVSRPNGMFSTLDSNGGRIFTYDSEGNLLYVFGGEGELMGMTRTPAAIDAIGDTILVLDSTRGRIIYYEPTIYGALINEAVGLRYQGNEAASVEIWHEIILINEFNQLAFTGIGRAHLQNGEYVLAMDYLRRGMDLRYYSIALTRRRQVFVDAYLAYALTAFLVVAIALIGRAVYRNVKGLNVREDEVYD